MKGTSIVRILSTLLLLHSTLLLQSQTLSGTHNAPLSKLILDPAPVTSKESQVIEKDQNGPAHRVLLDNSHFQKTLLLTSAQKKSTSSGEKSIESANQELSPKNSQLKLNINISNQIVRKAPQERNLKQNFSIPSTSSKDLQLIQTMTHATPLFTEGSHPFQPKPKFKPKSHKDSLKDLLNVPSNLPSTNRYSVLDKYVNPPKLPTRYHQTHRNNFSQKYPPTARKTMLTLGSESSMSNPLNKRKTGYQSRDGALLIKGNHNDHSALSKLKNMFKKNVEVKKLQRKLNEDEEMAEEEGGSMHLLVYKNALSRKMMIEDQTEVKHITSEEFAVQKVNNAKLDIEDMHKIKEMCINLQNELKKSVMSDVPNRKELTRLQRSYELYESLEDIRKSYYLKKLIIEKHAEMIKRVVDFSLDYSEQHQEKEEIKEMWDEDDIELDEHNRLMLIKLLQKLKEKTDHLHDQIFVNLKKIFTEYENVHSDDTVTATEKTGKQIETSINLTIFESEVIKTLFMQIFQLYDLILDNPKYDHMARKFEKEFEPPKSGDEDEEDSSEDHPDHQGDDSQEAIEATDSSAISKAEKSGIWAAYGILTAMVLLMMA